MQKENILGPEMSVTFSLLETKPLRIVIFSVKLKFSLHIQRDQEHGLTYRGPDYRVETPIENAMAYKASRGFNNSV